MRNGRPAAPADMVQEHSRLIDATAPEIWEGLLDLDLIESHVIRLLMFARGLRARSLRWDDLERFGFTRVSQRPPHELRYGLISQPWHLTGGIRRVTPDQFKAFDEPGYAVIDWTYTIDPKAEGCWVATVTTVRCTDAASRRRFRRYWTVIGPFSGLIRSRSLALLARGLGRQRG